MSGRPPTPETGGTPGSLYSPRIEDALRVAIEAHAGQLRKGLDPSPYSVHPVHVAMMLQGLGADEETVQAGLLHDVVEDCDGWTLEDVGERFGPRVRSLVAELTEDKSRSWAERKQAAIDHVPGLTPEAATIKACDKLHNLSSLLADLERAGDPDLVWRRFRGGREGTLRMARGLVEALEARLGPPLGDDLRALLERVEAAS